MTLRWPWLLAWLAVLAACPPPEPPPPPLPPVSTGKVRVRVFTEPAPITAIASAGKFLFVATDEEVQRWDDAGNVLALSNDHGLSGEKIVTLGADTDRKQVWILTDASLGVYDAAKEVYSEIAAPPASLGIDFATLAHDGATLTAGGDAGVWLGTAKGLFFVSDRGGWVATPLKDPVRAMVRDRGGWLWIASKSGLVARKPSGDLVKIASGQGCEVTDPRLVVLAPNERVIVIGGDATGHERIAIGKQTAFTSYRTMPELTWHGAVARGNAVILMNGDKLYRIAPASAGVRPLARDGVRLVALSSGGTAAEWAIDPLDIAIPAGATTLAATDDALLIGTRDLGTARYRDGDAHPRDWLRRKQMFEDATTLSVACAKPIDCWVATGARQAWHWTGERFEAGGPDHVVLAVVRDPAGPIYALHRAQSEREIHLSRIDGTTWKPIEKVSLTTAGDQPEVSFARYAASGSLWVGLRYHDGKERRAYGIAIVEPATGKVTYHRTESVPDKKLKMLPIPVGVVDGDVHGDTAWFATNEGVARLVGNDVKLWTEADGLRSELARAVTIAPEGGVIVATGAGAGVWDGKAWVFPAALRFEVNDVVATRNGQIWMATERGIAAWDGKKVRRIDLRRGLAENEVLDVATDQFDRVWARGPGSLTLISQ